MTVLGPVGELRLQANFQPPKLGRGVNPEGRGKSESSTCWSRKRGAVTAGGFNGHFDEFLEAERALV